MPISPEKLSYGAVHDRLRRLYGPASGYACVDCSGVAAHWAYDHADPDEKTSDCGPYSVKPEHYVPRCVSCHKCRDLAVKAHVGQLPLWGWP